MATKAATVRVRATDAQRDVWYEAAGGERTFSEWARRALDDAAAEQAAPQRRSPRPKPRPSDVAGVNAPKRKAARTDLCAHRVPPTAYCSRCD